MTQPATRASVPEANQTVVEGELRRALRRVARRRDRDGPHAHNERVLLLRAAPDWRGPARLTVPADDGPVSALVCGAGTVLAVLDALGRPRDPESYLVVLTSCDDHELGNSVLAQVLEHTVRPVNRWDLVADAFGVRRLDPRLTGKEYRWLAESLLDAQLGRRRGTTGPLLQLDTALRRLAAVRFGKEEDEQLDAAALLEWTRDELRVARFLSLSHDEQDGLIGWLEDSVGSVAQVVFRLLRSGQVGDAIPFGLAAAELYADASRRRHMVVEARIRAEERFFGGSAPAPAVLSAYAEAAESLTLRWSENDHAADADAMCTRAEQILAELRADDLAGASRVLDAGLDARLAALAEALDTALPAPRAVDLRPIEAALDRLDEHRRRGGRAGEVEAATCAVRLARWLTHDEEPVSTVADGALRHVRGWGWVDRATAVIFNADTARVPRARAAYAGLFNAVRDRRAELDRAFADRLAAWSAVSQTTDELLLAENLLARIARPVAERAAPLIIVLDGMSAAVACSLAEDIAATRRWTEVGRRPDGREPALATIPSTTVFSRASLLCGRLTTGGQAEERAGFTALWRSRRSVLFHKAGLGTGAGAALNEDVAAAIQDPGTVVGVVLNTIDDSLRDDFRVNAPTWRLADVDYLPRLMDAAATMNRPVILTADHGHVLEYGGDLHPARAESARYRMGTPGAGELLVKGPRVLATEGEAVVPWDERIRYLPRRAGYHGGVSAAEMVIPVLVFVPAQSPPPRGWSAQHNASLHEPPWWNATPSAPAAAERGAVPSVPQDQLEKGEKRDKRRPRRPSAKQDDALFSVDEAAAEQVAAAGEAQDAHASGGLGARIVGSELFFGQRAFARRAPADDEVATLIDALVAAGGKLPVTVAARLVGQPAFRMAGYLAQVGRLLNVDGYQVIAETDGGRTVELDVRLLKLQFLGYG